MKTKLKPLKHLGRPPLDLAQRLRNWGWYCLLREEADLSDYWLDKKYVDGGLDGGSRFFDRVRRRGSTPDEGRGEGVDPDVFERVHEGGAFVEARSWYESPLWRLLSEPRMNTADCTQFIEDECRQRGWLRATPAEMTTATAVFGNQEIGFVPGLTPSYSAMLQHLAVQPNLDGIALLGALFREAYGEFELVLAQHLRSTLAFAEQRYLATMPWPQCFTECLRLLIQDRILGNYWLTVADMPQDDVFFTDPNPDQRALRLVKWYLSPELRPVRVSTAPIVLSTERMFGLRVQEPKLRKDYRVGIPWSLRDYGPSIYPIPPHETARRWKIKETKRQEADRQAQETYEEGSFGYQLWQATKPYGPEGERPRRVVPKLPKGMASRPPGSARLPVGPIKDWIRWLPRPVGAEVVVGGVDFPIAHGVARRPPKPKAFNMQLQPDPSWAKPPKTDSPDGATEGPESTG